VGNTYLNGTDTELIRLRAQYAHARNALAEEKATNDMLYDALQVIRDAYDEDAPRGQYERFDDHRFGVTLREVLSAVGL